MTSVAPIVPPHGGTNVVPQHEADLFRSALTLKQDAAKHHRSGIGDVLMLGNGFDLIRCKVAKPNQVCHRNHRSLPGSENALDVGSRMHASTVPRLQTPRSRSQAPQQRQPNQGWS
jgi:hypothetical protein